ncbi:GNAT family N-acetyltransferase [Burkholderia cepacia]|uniref:GNAT family N-acetyltransferase n=1 Tax=Burkholderia cepacia TaxID=292 RepID=UPI002ABD96E6|nr:GNAT family N-acetyltransferase [Burkholderia cepacia]
MPAATPATLRFSTDKHELDVDAIFDFLHRDAYWSQGIPRDVVEKAIEGSLCFGAYVGDRLVGFARLVTDHATFAYLCDVFVLPAERGNGYGRALIDHVFAQEMVQGLRRIMLVTSDAHELYRPVGFGPCANPERVMEIRRPDIYAKR